jgi:hypothetical protein
MNLVKFSLLKRRADIDREAFSRHWSTRHVEVLLAAGHREYNLNYVQNHFFPLADGRFADDRFDGVAQLVQRASDARTTGFQDDPRYLRDVRPDERRFLEVERSCALFTRPVPRHVTSGPRPVKLMTFFRLRPDAARRDDGEPAGDALADAFAALRPLVSSHIDYFTVSGGSRPFTDAGEGSNLAQPLVDGVSEFAFESVDALESILRDSRFATVLRRPEWEEDASPTFIARSTVVYDDSASS